MKAKVNAKVIVVLSAAALVGVTIYYAQPQGLPSPKTAPPTTVAPAQLQKADPIPGLLKEVAGLKSQNAAQNKEIVGLQKELASLKAEVASAVKALQANLDLIDKSFVQLHNRFTAHTHMYDYPTPAGDATKLTATWCRPGNPPGHPGKCTQN